MNVSLLVCKMDVQQTIVSYDFNPILGLGVVTFQEVMSKVNEEGIIPVQRRHY